jgi:CDP-glucose 4,6-dehydratase
VESGPAFADGWNFGPDDSDAKTVAWVVERLAEGWGPDARWAVADTPQVHEAHTLRLDCSKAHDRLDWRPRWHAGEAVARSLAWHRAWRSGADMQRYTLDEIVGFGSPP